MNLLKLGSPAEIAGALIEAVEAGATIWSVYRGTGPHGQQQPLSQQAATAAAALKDILGTKDEQKNEALFAALITNPSFEPWRRAKIQSLFAYPDMVPFIPEFRWIIPLLEQIKGTDHAINALKDVTDEPSDYDMFIRARDLGLIEPEQLTWADVNAVLENIGDWLTQNAPIWYAQFAADLKIAEDQLDRADKSLDTAIAFLKAGPPKP